MKTNKKSAASHTQVLDTELDANVILVSSFAAEIPKLISELDDSTRDQGVRLVIAPIEMQCVVELDERVLDIATTLIHNT